jgi:hypothetical protein
MGWRMDLQQFKQQSKLDKWRCELLGVVCLMGA